MLERKQLLKLGLISIAAIAAGGAIGLALNYQTLQKLREEPAVPTVPSDQVEEKEEEKVATFSGTIKFAPRTIYYEQGIFYLENEMGDIIVYLKSSKIDLKLIEGWEVEVEGKVKNTVDGDKKIMEVDEVRL